MNDKVFFSPLHVKYFRIGNYTEASDEVKNSWITFVGKMMLCINKRWNDKEMKIKSLLSIQTTALDEALAVAAIGKKFYNWSPTQVSSDDLNNISIGDEKKKNVREIRTDEDITNF